jgi:hypothetical protein
MLQQTRTLNFSALASLCLVFGAVAAPEVPYGIGSWPEAGRGNRRAVVRVNQPANAVWTHIPWRRRDRQPEAKDVRVFDAATGQQILNVVRVQVTREFGDLVFQPTTTPGNYEVYYLPYNPGTGNFDDAGTYFKPQDTADPDWLKRNHLTSEGLAQGGWKSLPPAEVVEIQARGEFHRMDPMEVIATEAEVAQLLAAYPQADYLLFPEDRKYAIRMVEDLPLKWCVADSSGPDRLTAGLRTDRLTAGLRTAAQEFQGEAQPGEYYPFQIGVWAARKGIRSLELEFSDLQNEQGKTIPAREITCFNLTGTDWLGRPMEKTFEVGQGQVRPLWIGVQIPKEASGTYTGTVAVKPMGAEPSTVKVQIHVSGPVLEDGGVSDLGRLSRLKWLNSTLGLDDEVIPPYTPLRVKGNTIHCLGRAVRFNKLGLPESIVSRGRDLLAAPIAFVVETKEGIVRFEAGKTQVPRVAPGVVERVTAAQARNVSLTVRSKMEFDGCILYTATLKANGTARRPFGTARRPFPT